MAKTGGLGDNLYIAGVNVSGDTNSIKKINGGPKALDFTAIDKSAFERLGGVRDGSLSWVSYFNPVASGTHAQLSGLPTADVIVTYCRGTTLGNAAAALVGKQINYDAQRGQDGSFTFDVDALPNGFGIDWGIQLTAGQRTDTTATNGTGVDQTTVSTAFGWQAYLHVFTGFAGTSVTVKIQDSADNVTFADLSGAAFSAATGITTQRLAGAATDTVRRYVRAITTGTFTNATFAVCFVRNLTAVT